MSQLIYKIEFFSDWHMGTGLSSGSDADLLVIKDKTGLPFVPGKTLKGLFKNAAKDLLEARYLDIDFIREIFGLDSKEHGNNKSIPGKTFFSNAELSNKTKQLLKGKTSLIYRRISSTAIGENGQAKEHSLRTLEVVVPLTLYAAIENIPESIDLNKLIDCMKMIKRIGTGRNRGFGRCEFSALP